MWSDEVRSTELLFAAGGFVGVAGGGTLARLVPETRLRQTFAALIVRVAIYTFTRSASSLLATDCRSSTDATRAPNTARADALDWRDSSASTTPDACKRCLPHFRLWPLYTTQLSATRRAVTAQRRLAADSG